MIIDTHTHLDGIEFKEDIQEVVEELEMLEFQKFWYQQLI